MRRKVPIAEDFPRTGWIDLEEQSPRRSMPDKGRGQVEMQKACWSDVVPPGHEALVAQASVAAGLVGAVLHAPELREGFQHRLQQGSDLRVSFVLLGFKRPPRKFVDPAHRVAV